MGKWIAGTLGAVLAGVIRPQTALVRWRESKTKAKQLFSHYFESPLASSYSHSYSQGAIKRSHRYGGPSTALVLSSRQSYRETLIDSTRAAG